MSLTLMAEVCIFSVPVSSLTGAVRIGAQQNVVSRYEVHVG